MIASQAPETNNPLFGKLDKNDEVWYELVFWDGFLENAEDHRNVIKRKHLYCNYKRAEKAMELLNARGFCCNLTRVIRE